MNFLNTTIVIPAFNEAKRLPATLASLIDELDLLGPLRICEVLIADDGSSDETVRVASEFAGRLPELRVIPSCRNFGKGHAVRSGLMEARHPWILIADADASTPWPEGARLGRACLGAACKVAIGSRDIVGSKIERHQSLIRESLGKVFNLFVRKLTGLPFRDTQCGFKLVEKGVAQSILPYLRVDRFAWDVEFLLYTKAIGAQITEVPVRWEHKEDSRVNVFSHGMEMVYSVLKVRTKIGITRNLPFVQPRNI